TAKMYKDGMLIDETTTRYDCKTIYAKNPESCPREESAAEPLSLSLPKNILPAAGIALLSLIALVIVGFVVRRRSARRDDAGAQGPQF
ncbi:MAG: hypothetical protein AAB819_01325, partial [Patescibacteria group bacterium]